ncbi:hypothetical protein, partial [Streptomyces sp. P17]|uniref:hypothetical protein n=1 Tax=Streptomyces sp. P17 TaxID=3074716 RepID=UPI0028F4108F
GAAVDNRGSRFSGIWTFAGDVEFNSLFGGDQLGLSVTGSPSSALEVAGVSGEGLSTPAAEMPGRSLVRSSPRSMVSDVSGRAA